MLPCGRRNDAARISCTQDVVVASRRLPAVAACPHSANNRCDTQLRGEGTSVGVKGPVLEPQNGFDSNVRADTMLIGQTKCLAMVAGVGHRGDVR